MDPHKILLVDDNRELLRLLARLVEGEGWVAVQCAKGKAAISAIKTERPALAIVDVLLPDMMGYEVGAALRQAEVPFLLMTGIFKGSRAASEARVQHGAAGYFEKPFEARRLLESIRGLLPREPTASPAPARSPPPAKEADLDFDIAVESEEPIEPLSLTGKVEVSEGGRVSTVIRGEPLQAAGVAPRASPPFQQTQRPPSGKVVWPERADEGDLHDNLPELITAFWLAQQTGELTFHKGKVRKVIYFELGRPCFADSNLIADRFGPFLVRIGKLTAPQLQLCEDAAGRMGLKPADVLVEMGVLKPADKLYYTAQQVKAIAYSLFAWEEGRYGIQVTDRGPPEPIKLDLHPASLISRGVKKLYRPERLARLLPDGVRLIPTQQPAYGLHEIPLETWEAELLPSVDGTRTVRELIALAQKPEAILRASLWSLLALEILEHRTV